MPVLVSGVDNGTDHGTDHGTGAGINPPLIVRAIRNWENGEGKCMFDQCTDGRA